MKVDVQQNEENEPYEETESCKLKKRKHKEITKTIRVEWLLTMAKCPTDSLWRVSDRGTNLHVDRHITRGNFPCRRSIIQAMGIESDNQRKRLKNDGRRIMESYQLIRYQKPLHYHEYKLQAPSNNKTSQSTEKATARTALCKNLKQRLHHCKSLSPGLLNLIYFF